MPSWSAAFRAAASEREAIARISHQALFCMPGSTRCKPIFAVLKTPQTTFFISFSVFAECNSPDRCAGSFDRSLICYRCQNLNKENRMEQLNNPAKSRLDKGE